MYWRQVFCFRLKPESKQDNEQYLDENIYVGLCEPRSYNLRQQTQSGQHLDRESQFENQIWFQVR